MSSKTNTIFVCSNCDAQYSKWAGRCLECGKWSTIAEGQEKDDVELRKKTDYSPAKTQKLSDIKAEDITRISTDMIELDRVLGGGIVPGSLILLGGEPGIGKSTLAMQLATTVKNVLYISGEESVGQIKLRADRLLPKQNNNVTIKQYNNDTLTLANETHVETICATIKAHKPSLSIIDSIQTIYSAEASGEPGSPTQIRTCAAKLMETAKTTNTAIVIIGHVTKDGGVAGPKTLEHLVDTVLYLEGERYHIYRILRASKNRFGATDEVGIFEMKETGLEEVKNPSACFLQERSDNPPGSVITCLVEGTRPLLVEIQALVNKTSFGYPVRKASGFDLNRLHVLTAVLQKRAGLNLAQYDIHLNVVGGLKAEEPAVDLAVCLAIASAYKDKALGLDLCVFGEVGLGGEVRSVSQTEKRLKECEKLGMKRVITHLNPPIQRAGTQTSKHLNNLKIIDVKNIAELIRHT